MAKIKIKDIDPNTNSILANMGFLMPRTEKELDSILKLNMEETSDLVNYHVNPEVIINQCKMPGKFNKFERLNKKPKKSNPYFKRSVLAAEIVSQLYNEPTFGHVKLQKLVFLCENITGFSFNYRYSKQAAGPYDNKFMHGIDQQFKKQKWFSVKTVERHGYSQCVYIPGEKFNGHKKYFQSYFKNDYDLIQSIIEIFRKEKTRHIELVATLYSCWMELSNKNMAVNEQSILNSLYNWSPEKKKFTENEVIDTYNWMMVNNFVPSK